MNPYHDTDRPGVALLGADHHERPEEIAEHGSYEVPADEHGDPAPAAKLYRVMANGWRREEPAVPADVAWVETASGGRVAVTAITDLRTTGSIVTVDGALTDRKSSFRVEADTLGGDERVSPTYGTEAEALAALWTLSFALGGGWAYGAGRVPVLSLFAGPPGLTPAGAGGAEGGAQ